MKYLLLIIILFSCSKIDDKEPFLKRSNMFNENKIINADIIISRNDKRIVRATSDTLIKNNNEEALMYGNVISDFYNEEGKHVSKLYSDSARINQSTNNLNAFGNVHVVSDSGYALFSHSILWDNQYKLIVSHDSVMFTSSNQDTMHGIGFESDMDLSRWKILKPHGVGGK